MIKNNKIKSLNSVNAYIAFAKPSWMFLKFFNYKGTNSIARENTYTIVNKISKEYKGVLPDKLIFIKEGGLKIIYKYKDIDYNINCFNDGEWNEEIINTFLNKVNYQTHRTKDINSLYLYKHFFKILND